jgi:hypothetical protein
MTYMKVLFMAILASLLVGSVYAIPVTSLTGGTVIPMPAVNYFGAGPQTFGPGITWSSTNANSQGGSVFGFTGGYGFSGNGEWNGALGPMAGLNWPVGTMTYAFSKPITGVGGFINYATGYGETPTIAVYDSKMNLIESSTFSFTTGGGENTGEFHGFLESSPIISYFTITDSYIGVVNLTTIGGKGPVNAPEFPSTLLPLTMIIGFLGAVLVIKKTR